MRRSFVVKVTAFTTAVAPLELAVFLLVALIALKTTHGLHGTFDVGFDDETGYLDGARYLGVHYLPMAESSPLYPMWYRLLALAEPDRLRLYFSNWYVLTAGLPIALYGLARRSGAPLAAAATMAVAWSVSGSVMTWPFVTKFAALVLALGAIAATYASDTRIAAAVSSITLSLVTYARPELMVFALAFAAIVATWGLASLLTQRERPWRVRRTGLVAAVLALASAGLFRLWFGDPTVGGRAYFAFAQHYALNVVEAKQLPIDPWTNWEVLSKAAFPTATTIPGAAMENPGAFAWHIARNLSKLPTTLSDLFRPLSYVPVPLRNVVTLALDLALVAGIVGLLFVRRTEAERLRGWLPLLALVALATTASVSAIHPREHYVLPLCLLGVAAIAALSGRIVAAIERAGALRRVNRAGPAALVIGLALSLAAVPTARAGAMPALFAPTQNAPPPSAHENIRTIEVLRGLHPTARVVILESGYSRGVYTDYDYVHVPPWEKKTAFGEFVRTRGINVVVLERRLRTDTRFVDDPEFASFVLGDPPLDDFVATPVPGAPVVIMVRRSLLPAP